MIGVDRVGQRKAACEGAIRVLNPMVILLLLLLFELALALEVKLHGGLIEFSVEGRIVTRRALLS
jgi:hypothetical protein